MMRKIFLFIAAMFLFALSFAQNLVLQDSVHGLRYCEIIVVTGNLPKLKATVYNTIGCDSCPNDQWKKLDAAKLKKKFDAKAFIMNGPRFLLMNKIGLSDTLLPNTDFDSLEMKERAVVIVTLGMAMKGRTKPYEEQGFRRATQCVFNKGSEVYELISSEHTYVMQSYSQMIDSTITEDSLAQLQTKLKMPDGWQFKILKLDDDLVLTTLDAKEAFIIQDELQNTYQRMK
jgi:haloalkane dehalogenase